MASTLQSAVHVIKLRTLKEYGRLEPQACKWQVRLGLTCRKHGEAHQYRGPLPAYCDACDASKLAGS